jgi:hypothetical protein
MQITRSSIDTQKGPADWFTGDVYIDAVAAPAGSSTFATAAVHFTPGARTAWHTHPHGQTISVTEGVGLCHREGGPVETSVPATACAKSCTTACQESGQGRGRTADLPLFRRTLVPTELPGRAEPGGAPETRSGATQTGLEPATFAVTGRRANQLRHWAISRCTAYPQRDSNPRCRLERAES